jgi:hypothetical protein
MFGLQGEMNPTFSISEPKKPSAEYYEAFSTGTFFIDKFSYIQSISKQIANGTQDWQQLHVELNRLYKKNEPNYTIGQGIF